MYFIQWSFESIIIFASQMFANLNYSVVLNVYCYILWGYTIMFLCNCFFAQLLPPLDDEHLKLSLFLSHLMMAYLRLMLLRSIAVIWVCAAILRNEKMLSFCAILTQKSIVDLDLLLYCDKTQSCHLRLLKLGFATISLNCNISQEIFLLLNGREARIELYFFEVITNGQRPQFCNRHKKGEKIASINSTLIVKSRTLLFIQKQKLSEMKTHRR